MADIDAIERLLCQRYNVHALDSGELSAALTLARGGNEQPLRAALEARELYRWTGPIFEALGPVKEPEVITPVPDPEPEAELEPEPEPDPVEEQEAAEPPVRRRRRR
jgi:hypothetical protein